jgi:hypothetical protein
MVSTLGRKIYFKMKKYESYTMVEVDIIGVKSFQYKKFKYELCLFNNQDAELLRIYEISKEEKSENSLQGGYKISKYNKNMIDLELSNKDGSISWSISALSLNDELICNIAHLKKGRLLKYTNLIFRRIKN